MSISKSKELSELLKFFEAWYFDAAHIQMSSFYSTPENPFPAVSIFDIPVFYLLPKDISK